ncbi:MAG: hypothetical protein ACK5NY_02800 [Burkholderiaceae bacterium]
MQRGDFGVVARSLCVQPIQVSRIAVLIPHQGGSVAVRDEVALPLFDPCAEDELSDIPDAPLDALRRFLQRIFTALDSDAKIAEVLTILFFAAGLSAIDCGTFCIRRSLARRLLSWSRSYYG